jgi:hypothetical protein
MFERGNVVVSNLDRQLANRLNDVDKRPRTRVNTARLRDITAESAAFAFEYDASDCTTGKYYLGVGHKDLCILL